MGRPRKYKRTERYLLSLDADLITKFDRVIEVKNKGRSSVINDLIKEYLKGISEGTSEG